MLVLNTGRAGELEGQGSCWPRASLMVSVSAAASYRQLCGEEGESEAPSLTRRTQAQSLTTQSHCWENLDLEVMRQCGVSSGLLGRDGGWRPWARWGSITRSGVVFEVLEDGLGVVLLPQLWPVLSHWGCFHTPPLPEILSPQEKLFPELDVTALSPESDDDNDGVSRSFRCLLALAPLSGCCPSWTA